MEKIINTTKYTKIITIFLIAMVFSVALPLTVKAQYTNLGSGTAGDFVNLGNGTAGDFVNLGNGTAGDFVNLGNGTAGDFINLGNGTAGSNSDYYEVITTTEYSTYDYYPSYNYGYSYYPTRSNYVGVGYVGGMNSPGYINTTPNYVGVGYQAPAPVYVYPTAQPNYVQASFTGTNPVYTAPTYVQPTNVYPNQVLAYNDTNPSLDSVYLSDVPYTGLSDYYGIIIFISILLTFSAVLAYIFLKRKISENMSPVYAYTSISSETNNSVKSSFADQIASDKSDLKEVEDYARMKKVLLSTDASAKLVKLQRLGEGKAKDIINNLSGNEWIAIGESDIKI